MKLQQYVQGAATVNQERVTTHVPFHIWHCPVVLLSILTIAVGSSRFCLFDGGVVVPICSSRL